MSCCGQNRERAAHSGATHSAPRGDRPRQANTTPVMAKAAPGPTVTLRYKQRTITEVRGPSTGQRYRFEAGGMQAVDKRDVELLLATGLFDRVWG